MSAKATAFTRVIDDPDGLRRIFEQSRYARIAPLLRFERYFPRSAEILLAQEQRTGRGLLLLSLLVGSLLAAAGQSLWRMNPGPFLVAIVVSLPLLVLVRRMMGSVYGATSEATRFVEMLCFDERAPFVYLRRFEGEDPLLRSLTSRNGVIGRMTNPTGTDTLENLAQLLDVAGPVVGLGRPADVGIEHRIYRLFTPDEHWRAVVGDLIGEASGVLMSYEPTPIIDWELGEAIRSNGAVIFVLLRDLPAQTVRDAVLARDALPAAITALERPFSFVDAVSEKYPAEEHGLLVVIAPDVVRIYGARMHFQQLWDLLLEEVVHKLRIVQPPTYREAPAAYLPLAHAVQGRSPLWLVISAAVGAVSVCALAALI